MTRPLDKNTLVPAMAICGIHDAARELEHGKMIVRLCNPSDGCYFVFQVSKDPTDMAHVSGHMVVGTEAEAMAFLREVQDAITATVGPPEQFLDRRGKAEVPHGFNPSVN